MIKNIVFDLGNVILKGNPSIILDNFKESLVNYQNIKNNFFDNFGELDLGNETLLEHLNNCNFDGILENETKELLLNYYKYRPFNNEIIELMNNLKNNGYSIFILSNNNKEAYEYLKGHPILKLVDGWIVSCEYRILKPNEELYNILFDKFNIKPEESIFIDDKEENINIAKKLGMKGFALDINKGLNDLIEVLKANNINF